MKVMLDACVLFPTVLREVLLSVARAGLYRPLWSPRVLEEWARATRKFDKAAELEARGAGALMGAEWPGASVRIGAATEGKLWLPDPNDVHVLAAAIDGAADRLVTFNLRDFPRREVAEWDIRAENPDAFLHGLWVQAPDAVSQAVAQVHAEAERRMGEPVDLRGLLKRARVPRLAKALTREAG